MTEYGKLFGIPSINLPYQQLTTRGIMANKWNLDLQFNLPNKKWDGIQIQECAHSVVELKLQMMREYTDAMLAINRIMTK
jgi:hypothetical protein